MSQNKRCGIYPCLFLLTQLLISLYSFQVSSQTTCDLFRAIKSNASGIDFINVLEETDSMNIVTRMNYWNGGGIGISDLNKDGLEDLVITSNVSGIAIYKNLGKLKFRRMDFLTQGKSIPNSWYSGVAIADVNNDGLNDIFLCRKSLTNSTNILLENKGDFIFEDITAKSGLTDNSNTTTAKFQDFDDDGDLDLYILNNDDLGSNAHRHTYSSKNEASKDLLYLNENGKFLNVTSNLYRTSKSGSLGLGICSGDFDWNGTQEMYVANDLLSKDQFLQFSDTTGLVDVAEEYFDHFSLNSMGCAMTDFNNDLWLDVLTLDMLPDDEVLRKTRDMHNSNKLNRIRSIGGALQLPQNTLQMNINGSGFHDVAHWGSIANTDWSWTPLVADFNNDGIKDVFVSNSLKKDILDLDFLKFTADSIESYNPRIDHSSRILKEMANRLESVTLSNQILIGNQDQPYSKFSNCDYLSFNTTAAAFGDLDNDGDLDIVCNNLNDSVVLLQNMTSESQNQNYLKFQFEHNFNSAEILNAKIVLFHDSICQMQIHQGSNGFQSKSTDAFHFGLGNTTNADSVFILIGDKESAVVLKNVNSNQTIFIDESLKKNHATNISDPRNHFGLKPKYRVADLSNELNFSHQTSERIDFGSKMNRLNIKGRVMSSPTISVADFNSDSLNDIYISGNQSIGKIYFQDTTRNFYSRSWVTSNINPYSKRFSIHSSESLHLNEDGNVDLLLLGSPYPHIDQAEKYSPMILKNQIEGWFSVDDTSFSHIQNVISSAEYLQSKSTNKKWLFFAGGSLLENYPHASPSFIYEQKGDEWQQLDANWLKHLGIVSGTSNADMNNDGYQDLILAIENGPVQIAYGSESGLKPPVPITPSEMYGWWQGLTVADLDKDGDLDVVVGNMGTNILPTVNGDNPLIIYSGDIDNNGKTDPLVIHKTKDGKRHFLQSRDDLTKQIPSLQRRFQSYSSYAQADVSSLLPDSVLAQHSDTVNELRNLVLLNDGSGNFAHSILPRITEIGTCNQIIVNDMNEDGVNDLLLFGNSHNLNSNYGMPDASPGFVVEGSIHENGDWLAEDCVPLGIRGVIRTVKELRLVDGTNTLVLGRSNGPTSIVKIELRK